VLYMAAGAARQVATELIEQGLSRSTPVVLVESASLPEMARSTLTLGEIQHAPQWRHHGPVTILIGEVFRHAASKCALPSAADGELKPALLAS
jgi:siroheme synthase